MKRFVYKLSALGLVLGISISAPAAWAQSLVLETGHIDAFNVTAEDGGLKLTLKEDATGQHVLHDPQDVMLKVKQEAMNEDVAKVAEIGKPGYLLPMAQDAGLIWPGWDTQGVREGASAQSILTSIRCQVLVKFICLKLALLEEQKACLQAVITS